MTLTLFGAGNIGRSFIAPVFSSAGYSVTFIDVNTRVVSELNRRRAYDVVLVSADGTRTRTTVSSVGAVDARDSEAVLEAVAAADLAATAVGAGGFATVCGVIAQALVRRRSVRPGVPLDVILAENIPQAAARARRSIAEVAGGDALDLGLVETSIGKMAPIVPSAIAAEDPLLVYAEPYNTLIVDRRGFVGPVPRIPNLLPVDNIRAYVDRKLFIHNLGHAAVAYLGFRNDPNASTIAEALAIPAVRSSAERAMLESATGLREEYPGEFTPGELESHVDDLLRRFANRALGDTVFRVGRDLRRKLSRNDRIVGAMRLLARHTLPMEAIAVVYRAALGFRAHDAEGRCFPGDAEVLTLYESHGLDGVLASVSGLAGTDPVDKQVADVIVMAETQVPKPGRASRP